MRAAAFFFFCGISSLVAKENELKFERLLYSISAPENVKVGNVIFVLGVVNPHPRITYKLAKNSSTFVMSESSGELRLKRRLDRETDAEHQVEVVAVSDDWPPKKAVAVVRVVVRDVNDNRPRFTRKQYAETLYDDAPVGTVVTRLICEDNDAPYTAYSRIRFAIVAGNWNKDFRILEDGSLVLSKSVDFKRRSAYRLRVAAWDEGDPPMRSVNNATVLVDIVTHRYFKPIFYQPLYTVVISENVTIPTLIGRTVAEYSSRGLMYTLASGNVNASFDVRQESAEIWLVKRLPDGNYSLVVAAYDERNFTIYQTVYVVVKVTGQKAITNNKGAITSNHLVFGLIAVVLLAAAATVLAVLAIKLKRR
eukprot:m.81449 g.81449  ORF g.81449 m.81449 type:complete len:365 (+) comp36237_c0_seq17:4407-5501(+)